MLCKKFAKNLQIFYKKPARPSAAFLLSFYHALTAMLREIKRSSYTLQMTWLKDILNICKLYCTAKTVLYRNSKLLNHGGHDIKWECAFLDSCISTKIPMRRAYEVKLDVLPFTLGNGVSAEGASAGSVWFCRAIERRALA
jgi:hypothetical protein